MTTALEHVRYSCGIAGEEVANYVDQLQAEIAELEAEVGRLKTVPMKYRRMQFNAQLQDENKELRAQLTAAQEEAAQYKDELAMVLRCSADLRSQLAAAQELIAVLRKDAETYGPEKISLQKQAWLEADRQRQINDLKDQLAKAEQLWQIAQGRCDGLEEKLAKAEQRAAEWQPIVTAPKDGTAILGCGGLYNDPKNGWFNTVCWWSGYVSFPRNFVCQG